MPRTSTKEKRAKTIFITEPMLEIFASLKRVNGNAYVICSERMDGKPINNVAKAWKRICPARVAGYYNICVQRTLQPSWKTCTSMTSAIATPAGAK